MRMASVPVRPSSSPSEAKMKSELAKVTSVGEPLPQPAPMSPPVDMPNMPVSSCQEPPAAL